MFAKLTEQEKISLNPCGVKLPLNYLNFQYYTIKVSVTTEPIRKLLLFIDLILGMVLGYYSFPSLNLQIHIC